MNQNSRSLHDDGRDTRNPFPVSPSPSLRQYGLPRNGESPCSALVEQDRKHRGLEECRYCCADCAEPAFEQEAQKHHLHFAKPEAVRQHRIPLGLRW